MNRTEFIKKAKQIHKEKYDYKNISNVKLENYSIIPILCEKHGLFYDTVYNHLEGKECFECFIEKLK